MVKVLLLVSEAFGGRGGIAKFNRDLIESMSSYSNISEIVAIPRLVVDSIGSISPKLDYVASEAISSGSSGKVNYVWTVLNTVRQNPDFHTIFCGHVNLIPLAYILKLWLKIPVYLIVYGVDVWQPTPSWLSNKLVNSIDGVIAISELTRQRFNTWSNLKNITQQFLLPTAVDLSAFAPGSKRLDLLDRYQLNDKTILMTMGRLDPRDRYKGFDEIIEVLPDLVQQIPNIAYMIVGEGADRQRLEQKAKMMGLSDRVVFTGYISDEEKADHYRLADVFVMPGRGEGFGIVYLEAIACGIPAIGSQLDGSQEALRNGLLGILVDPQDPEDIKTAIVASLQKPKGVIPEGLEYFSKQNFEKRCHTILAQILS